MKFKSTPAEDSTFDTYLSCSADEQRHLLRYIQFLYDDCAHDKIFKDEKFAPSHLWKKWLSNMTIGFSYDSIFLRSGNRFLASFVPLSSESFSDGKLKTFVKKAIRTARRLFQIYRSDAVEKHLSEFKQFYPSPRTPPRHEDFLALHPLPYLRSLEVMSLVNIHPPKHVLEIGAGACTNIAVLKDMFQSKAVIVDLPDMIFGGYIFLKAFFPEIKIALPHDVDKNFDFNSYDVTFVLPYQTNVIPDNYFDAAFNMLSFQEMEMNVANNYLAVLVRALKEDGDIVLLNQESSRYIKGNAFENYDMKNFKPVQKVDPRYQNHVIRHLKDVRHFLYHGKKLGNVVDRNAPLQAQLRSS